MECSSVNCTDVTIVYGSVRALPGGDGCGLPGHAHGPGVLAQLGRHGAGPAQAEAAAHPSPAAGRHTLGDAVACETLTNYFFSFS